MNDAICTKDGCVRFRMGALARETYFLETIERYKNALRTIADHALTYEGDPEETESSFGLNVDEVVSMAHDNIIMLARVVLDNDNKLDE